MKAKAKAPQSTPEIGSPAIEKRAAQRYIGIHIVTPFEGMFAQTDKLFKELRAWVNAHGIAEQGPYFLRLNVVDMTGDMDVEVGFVVSSKVAGDGRVTTGVLPVGRYAHLTYSRYAYRGNKTLIEWARDNGMAFDQRATPAGDAFACRYEAYLTDYRIESRKTKWQINVAIKLKD